MFSRNLIFAAVLSALTGTLALPTNSDASPELTKRDDPCSNYHPMSLGQLEYHNKDAIFGSPEWSYDGSHWNTLRGGAVLSDQSHEYDRDNELFDIQRDRNIYLRVCDSVVGGCETVSGVFQIPSKGKNQWVASVTTKFLGGVSCNVDRPMGVATTPK